MKRFATIFAIVLAFGMVACTEEEKDTTPPDTEPVAKTSVMTWFFKQVCDCDPEQYPEYNCCFLEVDLPGPYDGCDITVGNSVLHLKSYPGFADSGMFALDNNFGWNCDGVVFDDPYPSTGDYDRNLDKGLLRFNYFDGPNQTFELTEENGVTVLEYYQKASWGGSFWVIMEFNDVNECTESRGVCYDSPGCGGNAMFDCVSELGCLQTIFGTGFEQGSWDGGECIDVPEQSLQKSLRTNVPIMRFGDLLSPFHRVDWPDRPPLEYVDRVDKPYVDLPVSIGPNTMPPMVRVE